MSTQIGLASISALGSFQNDRHVSKRYLLQDGASGHFRSRVEQTGCQAAPTHSETRNSKSEARNQGHDEYENAMGTPRIPSFGFWASFVAWDSMSFRVRVRSRHSSQLDPDQTETVG